MPQQRGGQGQLNPPTDPPPVAMEQREPSPHGGGVMKRKAPEPPALAYRGLDRCDLCAAALAPRERLAGLCVTYRDAYTSTSEPHRVFP
jgi:hypothetical protein